MANHTLAHKKPSGLVRPRQLGRKLVKLLPVLAFIGLYVIPVIAISGNPSTDFWRFWICARFLLEGKDIYTPIPVASLGSLSPPGSISGPTLHANLNPPLQTVLLAPFGLLPYSMAYILWSIVGILCAVAALWLIAREESRAVGHPMQMRTLGLLLFLYFPTMAALWFGQFSLVLLLLLAITWTSARSGRHSLAGVALGLAMSLKIFVALLALFFLFRRRWRLLGWAAAVFVACAILAGIFAGPQAYLRYAAVLHDVDWYAASWNASLVGFFSRLSLGSVNLGRAGFMALSDLLAYACSAGLVLGLIWLAKPTARHLSEDGFDLAFSFTLVAMLLISPLGWMYYFPLLLIVALISWRAAEKLGCGRCKMLIALAWVLSTVPHLFMTAAESRQPATVFVWAGVYFYALLLFAGLAAFLALRLRARLKANEIDSPSQ